MSELNKTQLTAENQSNFPNNNTGFITPEKLREFNQDMIDSLVDEQTYNVDSGSFSGSIAMLENQVDALVLSGSGVVIQEEGTALGAATTLNFVGASVTASLVGATATINVNATAVDLSGLNQFTASQESFNSAATASIVALQNFSSSLDATYATDAQLNASSSTLQANINTKLNTSSFNSFTQSYNTFSSSVASEINSLQDVTGSYATTASLNSLSSSLSTRLTTDEGNITSNTNRIGTLESKTGSYATTGSNTFYGDQLFNGSLNVTGDITASKLLVQIETASIIFSSGSNQFGDAANDVQTLYGSVRVMNNLTASGLNYPAADGLVDQFLTTNGAGNLSFSNLDTILEDVYTGEAITKGDPLYISGSQGAKPIVYRADAAVAAKMPVTFVAYETIGAGANSRGIVLGLIEGMNLTGYNAGQEVYVAEGGGWSTSRPTGVNSITQLLGIVTKGGNGGKGLVLNPGPATLPNLQEGYVWAGNSTNQPVAIPSGSLIFSGTSGTSGTSGINGTSGVNGTSGTSGVSGTSGTSATSGTSGTSATAGSSGTSGVNGTSGTSGVSGAAGSNGTSGTSGVSGVAGSSGSSGTSGINGTSGTSGVSGAAGTSGTSGVSPTFNSGSFATTGSNTFTGNQTITSASLTSLITPFNINQTDSSGGAGQTKLLGFSANPTKIGGPYAAWSPQPTIYGIGSAAPYQIAIFQSQGNFTDGRISLQRPLVVTGSLTASLQEGYVWVGGAGGVSNIVATSSFAAAGTSGTSGVSGTSGTSGLNGTSGIDGTNGTSGISGTNGTSGISGTSGTSGLGFTFIGVWDSGTTYNANDVVSYLGSSYASKFNNNIGNDPISAPGQWNILAVAGSNGTSGTDGANGTSGISGTSGLDGTSGTSGVSGANGTSGTDGANGTSGTSGLGFTFIGVWNGSTTYNTNDVVSYNGSSYASKFDNNTNNDPDSAPGQWNTLAVAGTNGTSGTDGASGTSGTSGVSGTSGIDGTSGINGTSGTSGVSGVAGTSGTSGVSGAGFPFTGSAQITGSLGVTGSIFINSGSFSGSVITNITDIYTNVPAVNTVVTLTSASYASLATAGQLDSNTLYIISASNITAGTSGTSGTSGVSGAAGTSGTSGVNGTNGITTVVSSSFTGSFGITGSLVITGSAEMNVVNLSITSNTSSIDLNAGNYFSGSLSGSVFFNVTNVRPGETAIVKLTTTGIPTASFSSNVRQLSGSAYVATSGSGFQDILTFVSFDPSIVYLVANRKFL